MFNFLKKKQALDHPFASIGVDMHSHLIPGIDDGAQNIEESIHLIKGLIDLGYSKIITTPHTYQDYYPNTSEIILKGLEKLKLALKKEGLEVEIAAASEYYMDEHFEALLAKKDLLTLGDTDYLLFELSFFGEPPTLESNVFNMNVAGYKPILAHPERYAYLANNFKRYERLTDMGCSLQINVLSLNGHYGPLAQKTAEKLLKNEMVSFLGTDMHNDGHLAELQQFGQSKKWKRYMDYPFLNSGFMKKIHS